MTIEEGMVWAHRGRTIQRNYELDKIQTETFKKKLETWMINKTGDTETPTSADEI